MNAKSHYPFGTADLDAALARQRAETAVAIRHETLDQRIASYDQNWAGQKREDSVHKELRNIAEGYRQKCAAYEKAMRLVVEASQDRTAGKASRPIEAITTGRPLMLALDHAVFTLTTLENV